MKRKDVRRVKGYQKFDPPVRPEGRIILSDRDCPRQAGKSRFCLATFRESFHASARQHREITRSVMRPD